MHFRVADCDFQSESIDSRLIAFSAATYRGTGTINGNGGYGFIMSGVDANLNLHTTIDLFRITIWKEPTGDILYDNQMGAPEEAGPTAAVKGGSIVINTSKAPLGGGSEEATLLDCVLIGLTGCLVVAFGFIFYFRQDRFHLR